MSNRKQILSTLAYGTFMFFSLVLYIYMLFTPKLWIITLIYTAFIAIDKRPEHGGQPIGFIKNLGLWKHLADYYPYKLIIEDEKAFKEGDKFIFGYHPHGIISTGAFLTFATMKFSKKISNFRTHLLTLNTQLNIPFYREVLMALGISSVSKKSINYILDKGESCVIVVGGASEALMTTGDTVKLKVNSRKGFIKLALQKGAQLVPVFGFGENDLYNQVDPVKGSFLYKFQRTCKNYLGFTLPLFSGQGIYLDAGLMPKRHPLFVVIGSPISVTKAENPSDEQISALHSWYTEELMNLYNRNRSEFGMNSKDKELVFV